MVQLESTAVTLQLPDDEDELPASLALCMFMKAESPARSVDALSGAVDSEGASLKRHSCTEEGREKV